jgi:hypothetical protein
MMQTRTIGFWKPFHTIHLFDQICVIVAYLCTYTFEWSCKELMIDSIPLMIESLIMKHSQLFKQSSNWLNPGGSSHPNRTVCHPNAPTHWPPWVHALNLSSPLLPFHPDSKYKNFLHLMLVHQSCDCSINQPEQR